MDPTGGIVSYVVKKLGDLLVEEATLLGNTKRDLEWVRSELRMMQAFLEHVATMNIQDVLINSWTEDVRQLAFRAEDVVDTFSLHAGNPTRKSSLSCCNFRTKSRHDFGTEIMQLRESIAELSARKATYDIKIPDKRSADSVDQTDELLEFRRLTTAPYFEDRDVVGLDRHVKEVNELLAGEDRKRSVVPIVGMGGLGKTTLAKKVYNNLLSSFDCTAWVDVSQKYKIPYLIRMIARQILKLSQKDEQEMNQDVMTSNLCEFLRSKKYLIILDDVWSSLLWDALNTILPDPDNGSRIIITTRKVDVARFANPKIEPYELPLLNDEQSQALFTKKVFPNEENSEQCCTGELASLREEIVKKCGGLPLAIIVVGGLLSIRAKTPVEWMKVAKKIDWHQTDKGEQCMGILALSYIDLPIHLRWCFLYLGVLPEDCEVFAKRLQRFWIAEGFIDEKEGKSMEETTERYFEDLIQRCLIQVVRRTPNGSVDVCRVHDLLLDMAVSEAKEIQFLNVWRTPSDRSPYALPRRLSTTPEVRITHLPQNSNMLRTLLIMDHEDWQSERNISIEVRYDSGNNIERFSLRRSFKLLRVLELGQYIHHLPEGLGDMVNLRYLKLSSENIRELPSSMGNLRHLQTLDVAITRVRLFPNAIWRIKTLRYLCGSLRNTKLPVPKTSLLSNVFEDLRFLYFVRADPWMETILPSSINLKELEIIRVDKLAMSRYLSSTIKKLRSLNVLRLSANHTSTGDRAIFDMDEIFSQSESHTNLHSLRLEGFLIVSSMQLGSLPLNLTDVHLSNTEVNHYILELLGNLKCLHSLSFCEGSITYEEIVFKSGWFPRLRDLHLHLDIKRWELEKHSLPVLEELSIGRCSSLEMLPEGLQHVHTLKELSVWKGNSQLHERLRRPKDDTPEGEDWYKIKHIKHVYIREP